MTKQQSDDRATFMAMFERLQDLTSVRYVADHLQKFGVGPYMLTAGQRLTRDIQDVQSTLGVDEETAIDYIRQGIRGLDDGEERTRQQEGDSR